KRESTYQIRHVRGGLGSVKMPKQMVSSKILVIGSTKRKEKSTRCHIASNASDHLLHAYQQGGF
ncbi:hypothetical protein, partial [Bacillus smithii]